MKSEAFVLFDVLSAWGSHPLLRLWRQNTGAAMVKGRLVRFGIPGTPDLCGLMLPSGRFLGIECKTVKGRQSDDQKSFERMITKFGGLYVLARSLADVDQALAAIGITR